MFSTAIDLYGQCLEEICVDDAVVRNEVSPINLQLAFSFGIKLHNQLDGTILRISYLHPPLGTDQHLQSATASSLPVRRDLNGTSPAFRVSFRSGNHGTSSLERRFSSTPCRVDEFKPHQHSSPSSCTMLVQAKLPSESMTASLIRSNISTPSPRQSRRVQTVERLQGTKCSLRSGPATSDNGENQRRHHIATGIGS